jgi:hypothetical protein
MQDAPAAVSWGPNRIDCFARGMDNGLYHIRWDGGPNFKGWDEMGSNITSGPTVSSWAKNRLDVFTKAEINEFKDVISHRWSGDGSTWSAGEVIALPGLALIQGAPSAVSWGPNRIDCFVRDGNDDMSHMRWDGGPNFKGWDDLGGTITSPLAVASWASNRLDCFAQGTNGHLYHRWSEGGTTFSVWEDIGVPHVGIQDNPAAVSWGPNRIDCFVRGTDDHMYHISWS